MDPKKKRYLKILAVVILAAAILAFAVSQMIRSIQHHREASEYRANTPLVLESGLLSFPENDAKRFSSIPEPWIALRNRGEEDGKGWQVIRCSIPGTLTADDIAGMKAVILCEDEEGKSARYEVIINGVKQKDLVMAHSNAVRIRCFDPKTGARFGKDVVMEAKDLPRNNPSDSSLNHSDDDVVKKVLEITAGATCPGYDTDIWTRGPDGELTGFAKNRKKSPALVLVPEGTEYLPVIEKLAENAHSLYIPPSVTRIGEHALDGVWFIIAEPDSYAVRYARENGIWYMESGDTLIRVPESVEQMDTSINDQATNAMEGVWNVTGAKALYIPPDTKAGNLYWLGYTGLKVLVDRDSRAELEFVKNLDEYRGVCDYTYYSTWYNTDTEGDFGRGKTVRLGCWEQDGNRENGAEPIEWIVLENDGETALLVSRAYLARSTDHIGSGELWMTEDFPKNAFTPEELNAITGDTAQEKIRYADRRDLQGYFATDEERKAETVPAIAGRKGTEIRPAIRISMDAFRALQPRTSAELPVYEKITFGHMEEDNRPLTWLVLDRQDGRMLLLCNEIDWNWYFHLPGNVYSRKEDNRWETSNVREWFNGGFLEKCFTEEERKAIVPVTVSNDAGEGTGLYAADQPPTEDRVFALSVKELFRYLPDPAGRIIKDYNGKTRCWYLRSPAAEGRICCVSEYGMLYEEMAGYTYHHEEPCPAMWVDESVYGAPTV